MNTIKMNQQDQSDWEFWKRVAKMFGTNLHGWSYRDQASFVNPQMEIDGRAGAKLIEQDDEITRLKALARYAINEGADMAAMSIEEWAEEWAEKWAEKMLREVDNA